jgi:ribosomal protein L11 methyltransferase
LPDNLEKIDGANPLDCVNKTVPLVKGIDGDGWVEVIISCEPGWEDPLSAVVFESGFSGLEEKSENGRPLIKAYGKNATPDADIVSILRNALENILIGSNAKIISVNDVPFEDWEFSWRKGLDAVEVGRGLVIKPSWVDYQNSVGRLEIIIDPKMAFGTGSHATTFLCLEAMENIDFHGYSVMDAGCGSGVLGITSAMLGASKVYCFDNDPFSVENAIENTVINCVSEIVTVEEKSLGDIDSAGFDFIFANIISHVLLPNLPKFYSFLKPGGKAIFSGLLAIEEKDFTDGLVKAGFKNIEISYRDEWIASTAVRPI